MKAPRSERIECKVVSIEATVTLVVETPDGGRLRVPLGKNQANIDSFVEVKSIKGGWGRLVHKK